MVESYVEQTNVPDFFCLLRLGGTPAASSMATKIDDSLPRLLDDLIRSRQHFGWNRQTDLLRGFQIDHELKPHGLLHWQISRFGSLQNFVHITSRAPIDVSGVHPVKHEAAFIDKLLLEVNGWKPVFTCKLDDPLSCAEKAASGERHYCLNPLLLGGLKGAL